MKKKKQTKDALRFASSLIGKKGTVDVYSNGAIAFEYAQTFYFFFFLCSCVKDTKKPSIRAGWGLFPLSAFTIILGEKVDKKQWSGREEPTKKLFFPCL